jgi:hypothetical protein
MNRFLILLISGSLIALCACPRQESSEQAARSDLISRAKAIHERVLALDGHIDIEVSFFTPEMPDRIGYQKLASLRAWTGPFSLPMWSKDP